VALRHLRLRQDHEGQAVTVTVSHAGKGTAFLRSHPGTPVEHELGARCETCDTEDRPMTDTADLTTEAGKRLRFTLGMFAILLEEWSKDPDQPNVSAWLRDTTDAIAAIEAEARAAARVPEPADVQASGARLPPSSPSSKGRPMTHTADLIAKARDRDALATWSDGRADDYPLLLDVLEAAERWRAATDAYAVTPWHKGLQHDLSDAKDALRAAIDAWKIDAWKAAQRG
jgi:hypothetical protein